MKRISLAFVVLLVVLSAGVLAASQVFSVNDGDYITLPWGRVEFHNNELHVVSTVNDPAGLSFRGGDGSKVSYKPSDGIETVLLQLRRMRNGDGEFYFGALNRAEYDRTGNGDRAMKEIATFNVTGVEFRVPVKFSAGVAVGAAGGSTTDTMWAPSGLVFTQQQDDGNFVTYRVTRPYDKSASPCAMWSAWTGYIGGCQ